MATGPAPGRRGGNDSAAAPGLDMPGRRWYRVDATFGAAIRAGQRVRPGDVLGLTASRQQVLASEAGWVAEVVFEPSSHTFLIAVVPTDTDA